MAEVLAKQGSAATPEPEKQYLASTQSVVRDGFIARATATGRLRFLTICSSNLDEFFEVRVAGLKQQVAYGISTPRFDGLRPVDSLVPESKSSSRAHELWVERADGDAKESRGLLRVTGRSDLSVHKDRRRGNGVGFSHDVALDWLTKAFAWAQQRYEQDPDPDRGERLGNCYEELGEIDITHDRQADGLDKLRKSRQLLAEAGAEKWGPDELKKLDDRIAELDTS